MTWIKLWQSQTDSVWHGTCWSRALRIATHVNGVVVSRWRELKLNSRPWTCAVQTVTNGDQVRPENKQQSQHLKHIQLALLPFSQFSAVVMRHKANNGVVYAIWARFKYDTAKRGTRGPSLPILRTKYKHTYKLHKICQFNQFIFGKIIKIVATRSHLLKLKCTKFDFGWGSAPDPAGGAHSASADLLAGF